MFEQIGPPGGSAISIRHANRYPFALPGFAKPDFLAIMGLADKAVILWRCFRNYKLRAAGHLPGRESGSPVSRLRQANNMRCCSERVAMCWLGLRCNPDCVCVQPGAFRRSPGLLRGHKFRAARHGYESQVLRPKAAIPNGNFGDHLRFANSSDWFRDVDDRQGAV